MTYLVIIPAYNEAERIITILDALVGQSLLPIKLIVVDDGSTDATAEIVSEYAKKYAWIKLVKNDIKAEHRPGGKVIRAFYKGFSVIDVDYDAIVKLDADVMLPPNYFERVMELFANNPKLGITGGLHYIEHNGEWIYEDYADRDHVKGPCKAYRKTCFEDIGGLRESLGWDTVDELLALYHGWEVRTDQELWVRHRRLRGTSTGFVKVMQKIGRAMYRMRYGFFITLTSAIKAGMVNRPFGLTGLAVLFRVGLKPGLVRMCLL